MTIRTQPAGALVYVDDYEIGTTPVSTDFTYYGTRKIRLVKDGYKTEAFLQPVPTPWYEVPGLDFISENLVPGLLRDQRTFNYNLTPQVVVPTEQLLQHAEQLRAQGRSMGATATAPAGQRGLPQPGMSGPSVPVVPVPSMPTMPGPNAPGMPQGPPSEATPPGTPMPSMPSPGPGG